MNHCSTCCLVGATTLLMLACAPAEEDEERASLDVSLERDGDGVVARFTASVPPDAEDVVIWFGDGQSTRDELTPSHTYRLNAPYTASLFYDDPLGGGRANAEVLIEGLPVPDVAYDLPPDGGVHLVAVNSWGFTHNYASNEAAHPLLLASEAFAVSAASEHGSGAIPDASVDFYATEDRDGAVTVPLEMEAERSFVAFEQPHALTPGWSLGSETVYAGGARMPSTSRTAAPEPALPFFLQNARFPIDEGLELRLQFPLNSGSADGVVYTVVGSDGVYQTRASRAEGVASVQLSTDDLTRVGLGVAGVYTTLYTDQQVDDILVRTVNVGYVPIDLIPTTGWSPTP